MSIRILLVDDNQLFRKGLAAMIGAHADFTVVGDMRGGRESMQAALQLTPDIVLMDIMFADANGLDAVALIKRRQPSVRIVLLTSLKTEDFVSAALRVGADGYVLKDATLEELLMSLRSVSIGKKYLSPDVSTHLVDRFLNPKITASDQPQLDLLTHRERSILQLIAEGRTNRRAAEFLSVSPKTVEKHRAKLMRKLGLRNATELTLVALELGLISRPISLARMMRDQIPTMNFEAKGEGPHFLASAPA